MRANRYKKNYFTPQDLSHLPLDFEHEILSLKQQLHLQLIDPASFCATYIITYLKQCRGDLWQGSKHNRTDLNSVHIKHSDLNLFCTNSLRSVPLAVNYSLCNWHLGNYQIKLFFDIPSSLELLHLQSMGIRCVTAVTQPQELRSYVENRDPLSFVIHDLIHAQHFFSDRSQFLAQVGFARLMLLAVENLSLQMALENNQLFKQEFNYGISDMNSHCVHLLKYLKAIFLKHSLEPLFIALIEEWPLSEKERSALLQLNTDQETIKDHIELTTYCELMGGTPHELARKKQTNSPHPFIHMEAHSPAMVDTAKHH